MTDKRAEPIEPGRNGTVRSNREATNPWVVFVIRLGFLLMMSALAAVLAYNGWKAVRNRHFDHRWTTTTATGVNLHDWVQVEEGEELLDGPQAVRFGIGLLAAAAMLAEWSLGLSLYVVQGVKAAKKSNWTILHSIATFVSLACLLTAMAGLLPPERFGSRPFTGAFYGTIVATSVAVLAAVVSQRPRLGAMIFPVIVVAAVSIAPLSGGIIFGFFAWLALATHVVLLVPSLREWSQVGG